VPGTGSRCSTAHCSSTETAGLCPVSGTPGKPVELRTVKALLATPALARVTASLHRFCPDPACDVVYFTPAGGTYTTGDLRVPVWQKEPPGGRMLCYCFGENEAGICNEIRETGTSQVVERVRAHIEAGRCACEVRNPRGACCLGDLSAAVRRIAAAVGASQEHHR
jgi:hypothetical protein